MDIKRVPISEVEVWKKNLEVRATKTEAYNHTKSQIQRLGIYKPVTAFSDNGRYYILGGRLRYFVIRDLKHDHIDISIVHPKTEAEKWEYVLSDNDQPSTWLEDKLAENLYPYLEEIKLEDYQIDTGKPINIKELVESYGPESSDKDDEAPEIDDSPAITKTGDLFTLGKHRLLCGDATKEEDVKRLMNGQKADMVFTDPPFAIFGSSTGVKVEVSDDNLIKPFFRGIALLIHNNVKLRGHIYICCDWRTFPTIKEEVGNYLQIKNNIVWAKGETGYAGSFYSNNYENLAFFVNESKTYSMFKSFKEKGTPKHKQIYKSNVWEFERVAIKEREHFAEKPLDLISYAIENSTVENELILDLFLGSGTTLIACEKLNRICYGMEIEPKYCDVIITRFSNFTGIPEEKIRATRGNG